MDPNQLSLRRTLIGALTRAAELYALSFDKDEIRQKRIPRAVAGCFAVLLAQVAYSLPSTAPFGRDPRPRAPNGLAFLVAGLWAAGAAVLMLVGLFDAAWGHGSEPEIRRQPADRSPAAAGSDVSESGMRWPGTVSEGRDTLGRRYRLGARRIEGGPDESRAHRA
ncbi:hypothetical protein AB0H42_01980 [Nocardia sp. NPDC050799]|uniref:hypothetical protein n=1 Tax=Nocardia sp. NPDC050799 TaxID=3154842 RepID=UPI00340F10D8